MATSEYPAKIIVSIVLIISDIPRQIIFIPIIGTHFVAKVRIKNEKKEKKEKKSPPPFSGAEIVELAGIEPASAQGNHMLSTCLSQSSFSCCRKTRATNDNLIL